MNCTKTDCPAAQQCPKVQYRGSICAALRDEHGLGDPLTNADKIRAMTDEELARKLMRYTACHTCDLMKTCKTDFWSSCYEVNLKWLKQEVEE